MTPKQVIENYTKRMNDMDSVLISEFGYTENQIIQMMKEYAHLMCEKQKEICADNAEADYTSHGIVTDIEGFTGYTDIEVYVLKQSIIQCKNATEI